MIIALACLCTAEFHKEYSSPQILLFYNSNYENIVKFSKSSYLKSLEECIVFVIEDNIIDEKFASGAAIRSRNPRELNDSDDKILMDLIHYFYTDVEKRKLILKSLGWAYIGDSDTLKFDFYKTNLIVDGQRATFELYTLNFDQKSMYFLSPPTKTLRGYSSNRNRDRIILRVQ